VSAVVPDRARQAFAYEAQTLAGERFQGTLEALSADEVQARLGTLQLRVLAAPPNPPSPAGPASGPTNSSSSTSNWPISRKPASPSKRASASSRWT
jgi:hypothetical protein